MESKLSLFNHCSKETNYMLIHQTNVLSYSLKMNVKYHIVKLRQNHESILLTD